MRARAHVTRLGHLVLFMMFLMTLFGIGWFFSSLGWFINLTATNNSEDGKITRLKTRVHTLEENVTLLSEQVENVTVIADMNQVFIDAIIANPPTIMRNAQYVNDSMVITATPVQIPNDGNGNATDDNIDEVYNTTSYCVQGPSIEVDDQMIVQVEISGIPSGLFSMRVIAVYCDGFGFIPGEYAHGSIDLAAGVNQTYPTFFNFKWTQEMEDNGGVTFLAATSAGITFNFTEMNYLVIRYRQIDGVFAALISP